MQVGFLAGLLNATLLPAVRKVVLSPHILSDEELMNYLVFTKRPSDYTQTQYLYH